jgi:hypothetical protein
MEGTTEPILVVIAHPIAGNPAQFATERALRSLQLDWRVLSFDVKPDDVDAALEGFAVTGITGVLIDLSLASQARQWYAKRSDSQKPAIDCLWRNEEGEFVGDYEQQRWVDDQIARHGGQRRIWIGPSSEWTPASREGFREDSQVSKSVPDLVVDADVIVINPAEDETQAIELDSDDWPANDGSTLVIDLSSGHPELPKIKQLGYRTLGENERRIGMLQRCLHRWTGQHPAGEVIHEAIEEYLSV